MKTRKIPATIVTQHPDHARKPYWMNEEFISTRFESEECFRSFSELGATEYKWDWEGKLVDESVLERLFSEHYDYFKKNPLGVEKFLTFRLPNPKVETEFRIGRAFMSIAGSLSLAKQLQLHTPPLFEVILPMTESADEMLAIQEAFSQMHHLNHKLYRFEDGLFYDLELIPLFEQVETIINSDSILVEYFAKHKKLFGKSPSYLRPYIARSDPALNSGMVATVLAIKIALTSYTKLAEKLGIKLYPMIGAASLPFRGGLTPHTVKEFVKQYSGIKTTTLQSAFRYDYEIEDVKKAIELLEKILPKSKAQDVDAKDLPQLKKIITIFEKYYKKTVEQLATQINEVAAFLPKRRERVQHVGLFGYSRGVGKVKLPRAIGFTGALYSQGIPPEILGTGRGLEEIEKLGLFPLLDHYYPNLKNDLLRAGRYVNKKIIEKKARSLKVYAEILKDIELIEKHFKIKLEPFESEELEHSVLTSAIATRLDEKLGITEFIDQAARLRKSMG